MRDIAVVIPLFNKGPHIAETLESVLQQTLAPREIIVIDDGSSDEGPSIVESFVARDNRIRLLHRSPPGPGGYAARNFGIEASTAEWIAFLDADDVWHNDHLQSLSAAIVAAGPDVGCGFSGVKIVEGGKQRSYAGTLAPIPVGKALALHDILRPWLQTGLCPIWTGASAFRRSVLIEAGLFPAGKARRGGDKDMWLRATARTRTAFSGKETAEFRQDTVNRVTRTTRHGAVPIVVTSALELIKDAQDPSLKLLKQLINLELMQYARYSAGAKSHVNPLFFKAYRYDGGLQPLFKMLTFATIGATREVMSRIVNRTNARP